MQQIESGETTQQAPEITGKPKLLLEEDDETEDKNSAVDDDDSVIDVSGRNVEFPLLERSDNYVENLYLYKNVFNLIPTSVGRFLKLKNLKFFGNDIDLFPAEIGNLVSLECLQVKLSPPDVNGLALKKLKGLKELELCKVPPRPSILTLLSEISGLTCLTKLSVCHFSIRYLPAEIGCLSSLQHLDLSFNKMKCLPSEISYLKALISLKVANNKLVEVPSGLSSLKRLEHLDLSNNRLTSLGSLDLGSMHNLQILNLQYNKLLCYCQVPSWVCCNLEGNDNYLADDSFTSFSVEMDVYETSIPEKDVNGSYNVSHHTSSSLSSVSSNRCHNIKRSSKRWKRQHCLQQKARQERLNNSRKWKGEGHAQELTNKVNVNCKSVDIFTSEAHTEEASNIIGLDDDNAHKQVHSTEVAEENLPVIADNGKAGSQKGLAMDNCSRPGPECIDKVGEDECCNYDASSTSIRDDETNTQDQGLSSEIKVASNTKRHSDRDLYSPKPCKFLKSIEDGVSISKKYSSTSFCSFKDRLPDGFYDAGRDRPFMPLSTYEQSLHLDSREVILLDRNYDEELDAITLSAQAMVLQLRQLNSLPRGGDTQSVESLQIASLLALFVSDHFGGSDRSTLVERTRKNISGLNYQKPFVCTCSTGNSESFSSSTRQSFDSAEDIVFSNLCEKSLRLIKAKRNSIIVPIGTLQFGVCRHRALLLKYLCDRVEPPIHCELVRGYLDSQPHAWNTVLIRKGDELVRMVVDACHPHDVREETDPEYFCRYIPLSRSTLPLPDELDSVTCSGPGYGSFPSLSTCDEIVKADSSSVLRCKLGSVDAAVKVRTLEVCENSFDEIKNFEYSCLGEVRMLSALRHSCIVEMYGHKISSKWVSSEDGKSKRRILQYAIFMEYIKGGSLKSYLKEVAEAGKESVPLELALFIAKDVASALLELHSKHIIHRDIKSENILIDLDRKKDDGAPIVKLCDFDRAVPLRSPLHSCCIAHTGIPPPDICVGTPRWMAPEVLQAMHKRHVYGMEVDIWSYGCLLFELLTLQVPYYESSEVEIHDHIQLGERPRLTDELEAYRLCNDQSMGQSRKEKKPELEVETLRFLVDLFCRCTEKNPADRPTAGDIYEMLLSHTSKFLCSDN